MSQEAESVDGADFVGRPGRGFIPDYRHAPATETRFDFPFRIAGADYTGLRLSPPTLGDLTGMRRSPLDAVTILSVVSGQPRFVIEAMRWPDVEVALAVAQTLLPPDMAAAMAGEADAEPVGAPEEAATPADADAGELTDPDTIAGEQPLTDVGVELGVDVNPSEYQTAV